MLPGVPGEWGPHVADIAVMNPLHIFLPQGPNKEAKTGSAEAGEGRCRERLARISSKKEYPEHQTPVHR